MGPLDEALRGIAHFDWIVFASRHAVAAVIERMPVMPANLRVAAVGQATAQVLRQRGWRVDLLPDEANAAALVSAFETTAPGRPGEAVAGKASGADAGRAARSGRPSEPHAIDGGPSGVTVRGAKILFPASSRALPTIAAGLTQLGAQVLQVEAYRTEGAALDVDECRSWIAREAIGAVTFASPSAVIELEHALGKEDFDRLLSYAPAVAIGPTTARELAEHGRVAVLAESATLHGLALTTFRLLQTRA
jgi:uroporphyrinogen III methyltransferase/synthase